MKEESNNHRIDPELEVRIVALVLGQASELEREQLDRIIDERPELAVFKREIEAAHGFMSHIGTGDWHANDADWKLSPEKRDAVLAAIRGETPQPAKPSVPGPMTLKWFARDNARWSLLRIAAAICGAGIFSLLATLTLFFSRTSRMAQTVVEGRAFENSAGTAMTLEAPAEAPASSSSSSWMYREAQTAPSRDFGWESSGARLETHLYDESKPGLGSLAESAAATDSLPNVYYSQEDVQVLPASPESKLSQEAVELHDVLAEQEQSRNLSDGESAEFELKPSQEDFVADAPAVALGLRSDMGNEVIAGTKIVTQTDKMSRSSGVESAAIPEEPSAPSSVRFRLQEPGPSTPQDPSPVPAPRNAVTSKPLSVSANKEEVAGKAIDVKDRDDDGLTDNLWIEPSLPASASPKSGEVVRSFIDENGRAVSDLKKEKAAASATSDDVSGSMNNSIGDAFFGSGLGLGQEMSERNLLEKEVRERGLERKNDQIAANEPRLGVADTSVDREKSQSLYAIDGIVKDMFGVNRGEILNDGESSGVTTGISLGETPTTDFDIKLNAGLSVVPAFGAPDQLRGSITPPASSLSIEELKALSMQKQESESLDGIDGRAPDKSRTPYSGKAENTLGEQFALGRSFDDMPEKAKAIEINRGRKAVAASGLNEVIAAEEAFSTFSLHVSDVSFKLAQAALARGEWPEAAKVRIEEFVNAFDYGDPMPNDDEKVACRIEQSIHPFIQQRNLMRVSMRTAAAGRASNTPLRITFLLDNSGSMERIDRQQTVRRAFALLTEQLTPLDQVTLISFARQPRLLADKVNGAQSSQLVGLIDELPSEGGTNIEAALKLAFEKAAEQQLEGAQNRIVLLTDGAVNLGDANPERLSGMVTAIRDAGIAFDAAGISAEGLNDEVLEALTRKGDGRYYLLDSVEAADDGFAKQIAGALRPSAKNVKVQVEFNPQRVGRYKLLGFEKHLLNQEDFRNDSVDAAEMAAEEAGVAVYQFETLPDGQGDVGSVSVRFRDLSTGEMVENRWPIPYEADTHRPEQAAPSMNIATTAALFAAKLRGEPLGESVDLKTLSDLLTGLPEQDRNAKRVLQLQTMINQALQVSGNQ